MQNTTILKMHAERSEEKESAKGYLQKLILDTKICQITQKYAKIYTNTHKRTRSKVGGSAKIKC